jgi:hypothetical protein
LHTGRCLTLRTRRRGAARTRLKGSGSPLGRGLLLRLRRLRLGGLLLWLRRRTFRPFRRTRARRLAIGRLGFGRRGDSMGLAGVHYQNERNRRCNQHGSDERFAPGRALLGLGRRAASRTCHSWSPCRGVQRQHFRARSVPSRRHLSDGAFLRATEPQIVRAFTFIDAPRGCSILGSGTSSQRMSPCHAKPTPSLKAPEIGNMRL